MSSHARARTSLVLTLQAFCGTIKGNFSPFLLRQNYLELTSKQRITYW